MSINVDLSGTDNMPNPFLLNDAARDLREFGATFQSSLDGAHQKWTAVEQFYSAPEQHYVHRALDKPAETAEAIASAAAASAAALEEFAATISSLKARRAELKGDILNAQAADEAQDDARGFNPLGSLLDVGEDFAIRLVLQHRADNLAEELRTAEDACIKAHQGLKRASVNVMPVYGGSKDEFVVSDVTGVFNRIRNGVGDQEQAMSQYLALLATLTPAQMRLFLQHNPAAPLTLPPPGADPRQNKDYWNNLPQSQRDLIAASLPSLVGNMEGIPYADRVPANYAALELAMQQPGLTQTQRDSYENIKRAADKVSGGITRGIISFDPSHPPLAAIAIGNMDTASNITWNIPGMGTSTAGMDGWTDASQNIHDAQNKLNITDNAVVAWVGYRTPDMFPDSMDVLGTAHADVGGDRLASALNGFNVAGGDRNPYIAVSAHSYGTTTSAYGLTRIDFDVDSVAFVGSAGLDSGVVDEASDMRVKDGPDGNPAVYATRSDWDLVAAGGTFGSRRMSPLEEGFGAHEFSSAGDPERDLLPTLGHSVSGNYDGDYWNPTETPTDHGYLDRDTQSLDSVARITTGSGDHITQAEEN